MKTAAVKQKSLTNSCQEKKRQRTMRKHSDTQGETHKVIQRGRTKEDKTQGLNHNLTDRIAAVASP